MKNMKITNCEQCFTYLPIKAGSYCKIMCNECGWTPDCDEGEELSVEEGSIKSTCEKKE